MEQLVSNFLETMKADGKSKCTLNAYKSDLMEFCEFFSYYDITSLKYSDLKAWSNRLESKNYAPSSRARKVATIKSFFRYLMKMEIIEKNPSDCLEGPKQAKRQSIIISTDEASELLFHARNDGGNEKFYFRDYTIVAMFLYTGIRREELTNITLEDVNLKTNTILIHGKGNKQRIVYVNKTLHAVLSEYISCYRGYISKAIDSKYLFPSAKSEKIAVNSVNSIVNRFFESAGIKKVGISAHILRKRFATSVFESTGDIALTSKLLGHSSPTVTMRYVSMDENSLRQATNCVNF